MPPGGTFTYEFDAEPFGLHLYHCHTLPLKRHIHKGLYGGFVVDPKGDLCNLLLTFPELGARDFLPWINEEDAQKKGLSPEDYAAQQAELWKKGLADWGQDGSRIQRLRDAGDVVIYTPGSSAGVSVSILKSFAAPEGLIVEDTDLLRERINTTSTSLLNLLGIEADPIICHGEDELIAGFFHPDMDIFGIGILSYIAQRFLQNAKRLDLDLRCDFVRTKFGGVREIHPFAAELAELVDIFTDGRFQPVCQQSR